MPRYAAVAVLLAFAAFCLACGGIGPKPTVSTGTSEPEKPKEFTRQQFDKLVLGKTPKQIVEAIGTPDQTERGSTNVDTDSPQYNGTMIYKTDKVRVNDPVSNKPSQFVAIRFKDGVAERVRY